MQNTEGEGDDGAGAATVSASSADAGEQEIQEMQNTEGEGDGGETEVEAKAEEADERKSRRGSRKWLLRTDFEGGNDDLELKVATANMISNVVTTANALKENGTVINEDKVQSGEKEETAKKSEEHWLADILAGRIAPVYINASNQLTRKKNKRRLRSTILSERRSRRFNNSDIESISSDSISRMTVSTFSSQTGKNSEGRTASLRKSFDRKYFDSSLLPSKQEVCSKEEETNKSLSTLDRDYAENKIVDENVESADSLDAFVSKIISERTSQKLVSKFSWNQNSNSSSHHSDDDEFDSDYGYSLQV